MINTWCTSEYFVKSTSQNILFIFLRYIKRLKTLNRTYALGMNEV